jgi:LysM repeat protein
MNPSSRRWAWCVLSLLLAVALPCRADAQTLRGSRASVERTHQQALNHRLHFYETAADVRNGVSAGALVRLEANADFGLQDVSYPYVLPETELFVLRLAKQYRSACGERMIVTSAMRPRSFRLANSVDKSVHPTGMAVDLRRPSKAHCLNWLRSTLLALEGSGVMEAVEERNPPHFHVVVFPNQYRQYAVGGVGARGRSGATPATGRSAAAAPSRGPTYRVRPGDSLWSIARKHGSTVDDLKKLNGIRSDRIVVNQLLVIPAAR